MHNFGGECEAFKVEEKRKRELEAEKKRKEEEAARKKMEEKAKERERVFK